MHTCIHNIHIHAHMYMHIEMYTLHYIALHYIASHYNTLYYITLSYIALHYFASHYIASHYYIHAQRYIRLKCKMVKKLKSTRNFDEANTSGETTMQSHV